MDMLQKYPTQEKGALLKHAEVFRFPKHCEAVKFLC